jgi:hypothetical protein
MINTSKAYQDYVVFVDSKALRGRSKAEYLRQVPSAKAGCSAMTKAGASC